MKQYIFITNQYLPAPGATGMCVHSVASEIAYRGFHVSVICYSNDGKYHEEIYNNLRVYKVPVPFFLREIQGKGSFFKKVFRLLSMTAKLVHIRDYPLRSTLLVSRYVKTIKRIIDVNNQTTIVASYTPLEAVVAMLKIKKAYKGITTIFYSTDTLSNEKGNEGMLSIETRTAKGIKWEKRILSTVDMAIIMECHMDYYQGEQYKLFRPKMVTANFPLLTPPKKINSKKSKGSDKLLVYAGTLYKKLRNPSFICEILYRVSQCSPICVAFMGGGDCDDIMGSYADKSNGVIQFLGMQPHSVAMKYITECDILLSIGNNESPMAPSKIYEYMSTGKPIIHTYTWEKDPCIEPLTKYGNALLLNEKKDVDINSVCEFIENSCIISFSDVKAKFASATPEYTADLICNL